MNNDYVKLQNELHSELLSIIGYWEENTIDLEFGGFVGQINHYNEVVPKANKGIILNSRILWSFAAASNHLKTDKYKEICDRAFTYLYTFFKDPMHQGVFWELDYNGNALNTRKQVYAQSFTIYALSEYYLFSKNEAAKSWAISLFNLIESKAKDIINGGYFEAFNEDWSPIEDMRLSAKDMNASKTMNTHLHVLEGYTTLLKIYDNEALKTALKDLVNIFSSKFLNSENHYELFFDNKWSLLSHKISYGHDVETAWLVIDAARILNDKALISEANTIALQVVNTFLNEAIAVDGAVLNEKNRKTNHIDTDRHWWPQLEALIGFKYANAIKENTAYIEASIKIWEYVKKHIIDHENGEWFFRVNENNNPYTDENKVGMWKAPYHNIRACILVSQR